MNKDLEWLARNVQDFPRGATFIKRDNDFRNGYRLSTKSNLPGRNSWVSRQEHHQARQDLGLIMTDEEEAMSGTDSAWEHCKQLQPSQDALHNKYQREIKPGVYVDVYDVLQAWGVNNPALQHLIKKALQPGERGHKSKSEDMADIVASALRAEKLEKGE